MPLYIFQCECGVRFEETARISDHSKPQSCPECGEDAPRWMPKDVSGVFSPGMDGTPGPQNTGVSEIDAIADRAIGESAKRGWGVAERRVATKREILVQTGADGKDLSRNPDGTYRVMSAEERGIHDRANAINSLAMRQLQERRQNSSPPIDER